MDIFQTTKNQINRHVKNSNIMTITKTVTTQVEKQIEITLPYFLGTNYSETKYAILSETCALCVRDNEITTWDFIAPVEQFIGRDGVSQTTSEDFFKKYNEVIGKFNEIAARHNQLNTAA
jgi:hypothetical protein